MIEYNYSISACFPNKTVSINKLKEQIDQSSIKIMLSHIQVTKEDCKIFFKDYLSNEELLVLDSIINRHDGSDSQRVQYDVTVSWTSFKNSFERRIKDAVYLDIGNKYFVWIDTGHTIIGTEILKKTKDAREFERLYFPTTCGSVE